MIPTSINCDAKSIKFIFSYILISSLNSELVKMANILQVVDESWTSVRFKLMKNSEPQGPVKADCTFICNDGSKTAINSFLLRSCTNFFDGFVNECTRQSDSDAYILPENIQADVILPTFNYLCTGVLMYSPGLLQRIQKVAQKLCISHLEELITLELKHYSSGD